MFKSGFVYSLLGATELDPDELEAALSQHVAKDIRKDQGRFLGWCPPCPSSEQLVIDCQGQRLMQVLEQKRVLPKDVVDESVDERAKALAEQLGRPITKAERTPIREEVTLELLEVSHVRRTRILVWWDMRRERVFVNVGSSKKAEDVLDLLRTTIGSLKVVPLSTVRKPVREMTSWLRDPSSAPDWLEVGDSAILKESGEGGSFAARKVDISIDAHAQALIEGGLIVQELAIGMKEALTCKVNESLQIKGLKFADEVREKRGDNDDAHFEEPQARFEGDFIITADALGRFVSCLTEAFGGIEKAKSADEKIVQANKSNE